MTSVRVSTKWHASRTNIGVSRLGPILQKITGHCRQIMWNYYSYNKPAISHRGKVTQKKKQKYLLLNLVPYIEGVKMWIYGLLFVLSDRAFVWPMFLSEIAEICYLGGFLYCLTRLYETILINIVGSIYFSNTINNSTPSFIQASYVW